MTAEQSTFMIDLHQVGMMLRYSGTKLVITRSYYCNSWFIFRVSNDSNCSDPDMHVKDHVFGCNFMWVHN